MLLFAFMRIRAPWMFFTARLERCGHFSTYIHILYRAARAVQYKTEVLYFKMYREDNNTRNGTRNTDDELLHRILEENGVKRPDMRRDFPIAVYPTARGMGASNGGTCNQNDGEGGSASNCPYGNGLAYGVTDKPLAIVYSPIQEWRMLYDREVGLSKGTLFEELDLPLMVKQNDEGGCCRG